MAVKNKIFIPTLISSVDYQPVRTLPHIYFYNGLKDCEPYYIQHYPSNSTSYVVSSVQEKFPYLDYYDGLTPTTSSNSLLFYNETPPYGVTPTGSLYTEYWDTYVSLLYNPRTRLINASAIIPLADYFEMELNDIVQWRGNYYHLRAINDYNLKDGTCKIQLLGPIIRDAASPTPDCTFNFSSSLEGTIATTTTLSPTTTTTLSPTTSTTTLAPTTTTTTQLSYTIEYLMIAGGGGGGSRHAGAGGAGGYITGSASVSGSTPLSIVVGAGGSGASGLGIGTKGNNTTFYGLTAHGGGYGGGSGTNNGGVGGSGGGAIGVNGATGGASSGSQGFAGGNGINYSGGGGGGASTIGSNGFISGGTTNAGGAGGSGSAWVDGIFRAGGGGGGALNGFGGAASAGGGVGSGNGSGGAAVANKGGGGGGAGAFETNAPNGGPGGSGIVIIRYSGAQKGLGGNVTSSGSYTYHEFTASGDFTPTGYVAPTTTSTTTTLAVISYSNSGRGNSVGDACSDATNNRTFYSTCTSITVGCTIYTNISLTTLLTGYSYIFIDGAVWNINSSTGVITGYSSTQC